MALLFAASIAAVGAVTITPTSPHLRPLGVGGFISIPMRVYRKDCWKSVPTTLAQVPGAGLGAIEPFQQVLKDGFYEVACVKDYMVEHGDKFGDGKFAYELGDVSNVSIVNYNGHVASEDREEMTHDVCFKFCRTIPDMLFFGLTQGRDCYCTPYYTPEASDSSNCDEVCPGDNTVMCGGMSKSSMFQMHQCGTAASNVADATASMATVKTGLEEVSDKVKAVGESMQSIADAVQPGFSKGGDPAASGLLQNAKVTAGKLIQAAASGSSLVESMTGLESSLSTAGKAKGFDAVTAEEALVEQAGTATTQGEGVAEELAESLALATPPANASTNASGLYFPVMYFVQRNSSDGTSLTDVPSTCGGKSAQEAIVSDLEGCAAACTANVIEPHCVGFSYIAGAKDGLCFLFEKLTSATYYTGCKNAAPAKGKKGPNLKGMFLQRATKNAAGTKCMAKLEDFDGTSIAPNPSGKCGNCLKKATKADRCFE